MTQIGGGIRDYTDGTGKLWTALDVATRYFRAGADKVSIGMQHMWSSIQYSPVPPLHSGSIVLLRTPNVNRPGSDAVGAAEGYYANGCKGNGKSGIEQISSVYGAQAVVISLDPRCVTAGPERCLWLYPRSAVDVTLSVVLLCYAEWVFVRDRRVYVSSLDDAEAAAAGHTVVKTPRPDAEGREFCWYQCTVRGGREGRPIDALRVAQVRPAPCSTLPLQPYRATGTFRSLVLCS